MKILAVDYGASRTGLAVCDPTEFLTTPITPQITLKARPKVAAEVCRIAQEQKAELIVVGLPLNMDGTEGERAEKSRKLGRLCRSGAACPCGCGTSGSPPVKPPTSWTRWGLLVPTARPFWIPSAPRSFWRIISPGARSTPAKCEPEQHKTGFPLPRESRFCHFQLLLRLICLNADAVDGDRSVGFWFSSTAA